MFDVRAFIIFLLYFIIESVHHKVIIYLNCIIQFNQLRTVHPTLFTTMHLSVTRTLSTATK